MGSKWRVDKATADRILAGTADEADVPEAYREVASLLGAARGPAPAGDPARRVRTLEAMASAVAAPAPDVRPARRRYVSGRTKLATGAAAGALTLFGGLTAAAALSGSVSDAVHDATGVRLPLSVEHNEPAGSPAPASAPTAGSPARPGRQGCTDPRGAEEERNCAPAGEGGPGSAQPGSAKTEDAGAQNGRGRGGPGDTTQDRGGRGQANEVKGSQAGPSAGDAGEGGDGSKAKTSGGPGHSAGQSGPPTSSGPPGHNNSDSGDTGVTNSTRPHGNQGLP
jgi:hypothetical protein